MSSHLRQLEARIKELDGLSTEVLRCAQALDDGKPLNANLKGNAEEWYRGARALLERENFSGLQAFDWCYEAYYQDLDKTMKKDMSCISCFIYMPDYRTQKFYAAAFIETMTKAMALLNGCVSEVKSRELSILTDLSFVVAADEFETASNLLQSSSEECNCFPPSQKFDES